MTTSLPPRPSRWNLRGLALLLLGMGLLLVVLAGVALRVGGYDVFRRWVESSAGQKGASHGMSRTIKVDGWFAPLHLRGWTLETESFTSTGWPGEAIGSFNTGRIVAQLDPAAIFHGAWRVGGIQVDHATIELRKPDDALKRAPAPKKPRPWYAFALPSRFECGPIVTPDATLLYSFEGETARITHAQVQADLIGRDLYYTATSGTLEMPYLPPLHVERLAMLVTRPFIRVDTAQLVGLEPGSTTRVNLTGTIGMRDNHEIAASGEVTDLPIEQLLPEQLRPLVHGTASGHVTWHRDVTGRVLDSDGDLTLKDASISDISIFKQLAVLNGNPDLRAFNFDQATASFHLHGGRVALDVHLHAPQFTLEGRIAYILETKAAELDVTLSRLPLQTWLPTDFKPGASGEAQAHLVWQGRLETVKDSSGRVQLGFDGGIIATPAILRHLMASKKLRSPRVIQFQRAQFDISYEEQRFHLTRGELVMPGILSAQLQGELSPDRRLQARLAWQGLTIQDWLPPQLADRFAADITGQAQLDVQDWKMNDGRYGGTVQLLKGRVNYTPFQSLLARFVDDRELLDLPLTRASFAWTWQARHLQVSAIDLRCGEHLGLKGAFAVAPDKSLSGVVWIGTKRRYLDELSGLGEAVFSRHEDGLDWARVRLSGTIRRPRQDLAGQVAGQLARHPLAVFGVGAKVTSWYLGNLFGEKEDWEAPLEKLESKK